MTFPSPVDGCPTTTTAPAPAHDLAALRGLFALGGFVIASWAVRIPDIADQVGAGHGDLGVALLGVSVGALATMRLTGALCERIGAGPVSTVAAVLVCVGVVAPGLAGSVTGLGAALLVLGALTGVLNVAMNSLGVRLEAAAGRPMLSTLHAAFSFGGLGGSVVGGLAATAAAPGAHLLGVAAGGLLLVSVLARPLLGADRTRPTARAGEVREPGGRLEWARGTVLTLGAIAACTAYGEGALSDWAALHLATDVGAGPLWAAAGYACFSLAMAGARLAGHRLLGLLGEARLLVGGGLLAAAGMLPAALSANLAPALAGLVLVGVGLANVFPLVIARAGALGGARGIGLATTVGYAGLLAGPAVIGLLAARVGLPGALTSVSLLALLGAVLSGSVAGSPVPSAGSVGAAPRAEAGVAVADRLRARRDLVAARAQAAADRHVGALAILVPDTGGASRHEARRAPGQARRPSGANPDLELLLGRYAPQLTGLTG